MTPQFQYSLLTTSDQTEQLGAILGQCFNFPAGMTQQFMNHLGLENFRVLQQAGQVVGGLGILPMGQWWGGQCIPMGGVATVGIAPEHRGSGAALVMMQQAVQELYAQNIPLSVLYPAVPHLYRKAGYEQAGVFCGWEIATDTIRLKDRSLPIHAVPSLDREIFQPLYNQQARQMNGLLDRHASIWTRILRADPPETVYGYLFGSPQQPEGYLIFSQTRTPDTSILSLRNSVIQVRDWVVLTPAATTAFWTILADHRSQIKTIQWKGAAVDPLTLVLPEQTAKPQTVERWMLRIVNVQTALEQRGYAIDFETELHLQVEDDLIPENNRKFVLSVAPGQAEVNPGGRGEMYLSIRGLAALYAGLFTPRQLQLTGHLEASTAALTTASQLFAGPSPWLPDFF